jgi:hypothetical protein
MAMTRAKASQVTAKLDATGSTVRGLDDKLAEFVSVKDFGAVGDGVTDDTAAIQAALVASRQVYFPPGNYLISSALQPNTGHTLVGAGRRSGGTTITVATNTINAFEPIGNARAVIIKGFALNSPTGGSNSAFYIDPVSGLVESTIEDVDVSSGFLSALRGAELFWNNAVRDCRFFAREAIYIVGTTGTSIKNLFENVYVDHSGGTSGAFKAIHIASVFTTKFLNCNFGGVETVGATGEFLLAENSCYGISFDNCNFEKQIVAAGSYAFRHFTRGDFVYDGCTFVVLGQAGANAGILFGSADVDGNINISVRSCRALNNTTDWIFVSQNGSNIDIQNSPTLNDETKVRYLTGGVGFGNLVSESSGRNQVTESLTYRKGGALRQGIVTKEMFTRYQWAAATEDIIAFARAPAPSASDQSAVVSGEIMVAFAGRNDAGSRTTGYAKFEFYYNNDAGSSILRTAMMSTGSRTVDLALAQSGDIFSLTVTPNLGNISGAKVSVHMKYVKSNNLDTHDIGVSFLK